MTSGSEKRIRNRILPIRFDAAEHEVVATAAQKAGLSTSSYARKVLLGAEPPRQMRRPSVEAKALARLLGELGKIGGNLNQLARSANSGIVVYDGEILASIADLKVLREAILNALGRGL
jgi:hypothetical protein